MRTNRLSWEGWRAAALAGWLAAGLASVQAVEAPPAPPLVGKGPLPGSWTVEVKQKLPPPPPPTDPKLVALAALLQKTSPAMVRQTVEQEEDDRHEETLWDNGTRDTLWFYRGIVLYQPRNFQADRLLAAPVGAPMIPHRASHDFPELDWIQAERFTGTVVHDGRRCHLYRKASGGGTSASGTLSAWIDAETRLPVAIEIDAVLTTYTFHEGSPPLTPQGVFADYYQRAVREAAQTDPVAPSSP